MLSGIKLLRWGLIGQPADSHPLLKRPFSFQVINSRLKKKIQIIFIGKVILKEMCQFNGEVVSITTPPGINLTSDSSPTDNLKNKYNADDGTVIPRAIKL